MRILVILCAALALTACKKFRRGRGGGAAGVQASGAVPQTDDERALYALGSLMGERLQDFRLGPRELAIVQRGINDRVTGARPIVEVDRYRGRLRGIADARVAAQAQETRRAGAAYAERAAQESGAERLPSGLVYRELRAGDGTQPTARDEVTVHYRGTLIDGTEFDSSHRRGEPATFELGGVIPCWTEGVQRMRVGGRSRLVCPPDIAYGDRPQRVIPPGSTLVFEVELLGVRSREPAGGGDAGRD